MLGLRLLFFLLCLLLLLLLFFLLFLPGLILRLLLLLALLVPAALLLLPFLFQKSRHLPKFRIFGKLLQSRVDYRLGLLILAVNVELRPRMKVIIGAFHSGLERDRNEAKDYRQTGRR